MSNRALEMNEATDDVINVLVSKALTMKEAVQVLEKAKEELQHARLSKNGNVNSALL